MAVIIGYNFDPNRVEIPNSVKSVYNVQTSVIMPISLDRGGKT
jgi:hypothetical protein